MTNKNYCSLGFLYWTLVLLGMCFIALRSVFAYTGFEHPIHIELDHSEVNGSQPKNYRDYPEWLDDENDERNSNEEADEKPNGYRD